MDRGNFQRFRSRLKIIYQGRASYMKTLRLIALTTGLITTSLVAVTPGWAQLEPSTAPASQPSQSSDLEKPRADALQVDATEPLQVTDQQRDQFFTPVPKPDPIRAEPGTAQDSDSLIQPPPGSQTPGQLTPTQRLSFPIR